MPMYYIRLELLENENFPVIPYETPSLPSNQSEIYNLLNSFIQSRDVENIY